MSIERQDSKPTIRDQPVSLIELFYDLIYVYAISKMTSIFQGAPLTPDTFFRYLISSFVVLQAWMYMTNYINRFERNRLYENVALVINMCATVFMSNTISSDWSQMFPVFNTSMLVILGVVAILYAIRLREGDAAHVMASFSLRTLVPVCLIYLIVALSASVLSPRAALALDTVAILIGIFGPAVVNRGMTLDLSLISFPHLSERFELITIITFGETIVTVAEVFALAGLSIASLMTFTCVILLFGCYIVQMHNLIDHHQQRRGLRMIYSHFFIVIALNLFTVGLNLLIEEPEPTLAVCLITAAAIVLFFTCLLLLSKYHRHDVSFAPRDWTILTASITLGTAITFAGVTYGIKAFLAGPLLTSLGCFAWLFARDRKLIDVKGTKPLARR